LFKVSVMILSATKSWLLLLLVIGCKPEGDNHANQKKVCWEWFQ
jgi:hypothetical protein